MTIGALPPKEFRCTFPVPCWMLFTICPGVTALGARTVEAPEGAPVIPGGGDRPRVVLSRSGLLPLTLMLPRGTLPAGLMVPMGEAFLCKPPVEPTAPRPDFMGIPEAPTMFNAGEGELPRVAGLAGKTTTLAPEPPPPREPPP